MQWSLLSFFKNKYDNDTKTFIAFFKQKGNSNRSRFQVSWKIKLVLVSRSGQNVQILEEDAKDLSILINLKKKLLYSMERDISNRNCHIACIVAL